MPPPLRPAKQPAGAERKRSPRLASDQITMALKVVRAYLRDATVHGVRFATGIFMVISNVQA